MNIYFAKTRTPTSRCETTHASSSSERGHPHCARYDSRRSRFGRLRLMMTKDCTAAAAAAAVMMVVDAEEE
jgi:hypothetical protein